MAKWQYAIFDVNISYHEGVYFHWDQGDDFLQRALAFLGTKILKKSDCNTTMLRVDQHDHKATVAVLAFLGSEEWEICSETRYAAQFGAVYTLRKQRE